MSRILLAWELGAASGHLARLRPIVEVLLERGHQVALAAQNQRGYLPDSIFRLFRLRASMSFMAGWRIPR